MTRSGLTEGPSSGTLCNRLLILSRGQEASDCIFDC